MKNVEIVMWQKSDNSNIPNRLCCNQKGNTPLNTKNVFLLLFGERITLFISCVCIFLGAFIISIYKMQVIKEDFVMRVPMTFI